jgi:ADP-ribosylation factor family
MLDKIFGSKEMRLLMLGLDAAGKTSTFGFMRRFHLA